MMTDEMYFFDTYVFFEINNKNINYDKYKDCQFVTTVFNLAELNWIMKIRNKEDVDETTLSLQDYISSVHAEDVCKAMDFRKQMKKKKINISAADAIGYIIAEKLNIKFLTGDKEFEGMKNVEFVR